MKKNANIVLILVLGLVAFSSCLMTRDDVSEETERKAVVQQVSTLQKDHADQKMRTTELNEELRSISGRLESLENRATVATHEREKYAASNDAQMAEAQKKINLLQDEVQKLQNQVASLSQDIVKLESHPGSSKTATVNEKPADSDKGKGKVDHFALGDSSFKQKDYKQAIVEYQKYRDSFPSGKKFPAATFRIGVSFKELGMMDDAKTFFEEVQSKFPESPFAKMAKEQLKSK